VPVIADLKKMPHLLIAGATGSGKSVCVNSIVLSLLCRMNPRDLRLVMVDPKMLELTGYNGIPQLLMPVVTEARSAAKALRFLVAEMQRRYQRLARRGVRDIESYNASLDQHAGLTPEVPEDEGTSRTSSSSSTSWPISCSLSATRSRTRSPAWPRWRGPWASIWSSRRSVPRSMSSLA